MKIATFTDALFARKSINRVQTKIEQTATRLSSGLRVNSAHDDAAGLAISERMLSRIRGLRVNQRNINDGISLLQTAEGALSEITNMMQRMRDLAMRASGIITGANSGEGALYFSRMYEPEDKQALQSEIDELLSEIDRIAENAQFNGISLFNTEAKTSIVTTIESNASSLTDALKKTWLEQSESMISTYFGLTADNADLNIVYDNNGVTGGVMAQLTSGTFDAATGLSGDLTLTLDLSDFSDPTLPNGGSGWMYYDRIIAEEMTKAVMSRTVNMQALPDWFKEGAAQLIHGADKQVAADGGVAAVMATDLTIWGDEGSAEYSKAYLAARYINDILESNGKSMVDLFNSLEANRVGAETNITNYFYKEIKNLTGVNINNENNFMSKFSSYASANYLGLNLTNSSDTGAIGGAEASGGARATSDEDVMPDTVNFQSNPTNFNVIFPSSSIVTTTNQSRSENSKMHIDIQTGTQVNDVVTIDLAIVNTRNLNLGNLDVVNNSHSAIEKIDAAINYVVDQRARMGATQNRLEYALHIAQIDHESTSASRSRITDTDYAVEMTGFTKSQILMQSSTAVLAQTNITPEYALDLLTQQKSNLSASLATRARAQGLEPV